MAGMLPKSRESFNKLPDARIAIVASMWHPECVDKMVERAVRELHSLDVKQENLSVHRIPGSLELPFAARVLFEADSSLDAILAFGVVLKGATTHDDTVLQQVVDGFGRISERFAKPIINEVIGVSNLEDARARAGDDERNKGYEAVFAVSELLPWMKKTRKEAEPKRGAGFSLSHEG